MNKKEALKACYRRGLGGAPYIATGATGSVGAETALELALADGCTFGAGSRGDSYSGGGPPYMAAVAPQAVSASAARPTASGPGEASAPDAPADYRKIIAGQVPGSDFYVVGGITELNYNIRSAGVDAYVGDKDSDGLKGNFRRRVFIMNIALDLRLVNTRTLEVVDVISYQKQVVGREVSLGVFDFLNGTIIDVGAEVTHLKRGQRVVTVNAFGSHAELRSVFARTAWVIPDGLDIKQAAAIPVTVVERIRAPPVPATAVERGWAAGRTVPADD